MALRHSEPRRWNLDEFTRMVSAGLLGPDERVELLEGEIIEMSPQNPPHAAGVHKAKEALSALYSTSRVRVASPLNVGTRSQPGPDVGVVEQGPDAYADRHPCSALLVVEVSDASLEFDRSAKADIYAEGGVLPAHSSLRSVHERLSHGAIQGEDALDRPRGRSLDAEEDVVETGRLARVPQEGFGRVHSPQEGRSACATRWLTLLSPFLPTW